MLLSLTWLREFVSYEGDAASLGESLTMAGLELEGVSRPYAALRSIVVGHVVACAPHPEADKLSVCRVDVGDEVLDIVCGAPNVAMGQKVPVAKVGVTLPTGLAIKKAVLRGQPSHGMICSERELSLSEEHDGIMTLDPAARPGALLSQALVLDEEVLDISVTPNRGDCLSVLGLAREVAALTGLPLRMPPANLREQGKEARQELCLEIDRPDLCPLYHGRIIEGAATRKSPDWLRFRLQAVGVRPISNLVDVTNYILMELGQPLHAFDLDRIRGGKVIVRGADQGEICRTLDGQDRRLISEDITIRDAQGIIALGGVMGGLDSEITEQSRRVFLESAIFQPSAIRKTARRLGLHSEASYRFERGVDQTGAGYALDRAAAMMAELSGGVVRPGRITNEPLPWVSPRITLRKQRAEDLLGIALEDSFCTDIFERLGCGLEPDSGRQTPLVWAVTPPSYRRDLTREADLIEELARLYGVDRIPPSLPSVKRLLESAGAPEPRHAFISAVKHWGRRAGLHESVTYSFVSHKELDHLGISQEGRISIMNPLSDDMNVLHPHLAPGLLFALRNNLAQGAPSVRLFTCASAFCADSGSETTAREVPHLGILLYGARFEQGWPQPAAELDYQDLKGLLEHLLAAFALPAARFAQAAQPLPWLAPCVEISVKGAPIGFAGRVKPALADPYHAKKSVWTAEINLDALFGLRTAAHTRFMPLPVFPPVRRDITFIAPPTVSAGAISDAVDSLAVPMLISIGLIDCFEPKDRDERNLTFRLTFRHAERTLKDAEADKQRDAVVQGVQKLLPVRV